MKSGARSHTSIQPDGRGTAPQNVTLVASNIISHSTLSISHALGIRMALLLRITLPVACVERIDNISARWCRTRTMAATKWRDVLDMHAIRRPPLERDKAQRLTERRAQSGSASPGLI
jgi:hypothetical protein